jgi:hypothetical protein
MSQVIPQTFQNLASDPDIFPGIPQHLHPLEVIAAASVLAQSLALSDEPDRHHFMQVIPIYLKTLPSDELEAASVVKRDASRVLKLELVADHDELVRATAAAAAAAARVVELQSIQNRKLARIRVLDAAIKDAENRLEPWQLDWDGEQVIAEKLILENYGFIQVNAPFDTLSKIAVLRKLAPQAITAIKAEIAAHNAELDKLTAAPPKAKSAA